MFPFVRAAKEEEHDGKHQGHPDPAHAPHRPFASPYEPINQVAKIGNSVAANDAPDERDGERESTRCFEAAGDCARPDRRLHAERAHGHHRPQRQPVRHLAGRCAGQRERAAHRWYADQADATGSDTIDEHADRDATRGADQGGDGQSRRSLRARPAKGLLQRRDERAERINVENGGGVAKRSGRRQDTRIFAIPPRRSPHDQMRSSLFFPPKLSGSSSDRSGLGVDTSQGKSAACVYEIFLRIPAYAGTRSRDPLLRIPANAETRRRTLLRHPRGRGDPEVFLLLVPRVRGEPLQANASSPSSLVRCSRRPECGS